MMQSPVSDTNMYDLTIFIPTRGREHRFNILFNILLPWIKERSNVQLVCAIQDDYVHDYMSIDEPNVKIVRGDRHHLFLKEQTMRYFNYLRGLSHCDGKYTLILEDDDYICLNTLDAFLNNDIKTKACFYVYNITQNTMKMKIHGDICMTGHDFIKKFPDIFGSNFQWGQCITKTKFLHDALRDCYILLGKKTIVQMDEIVMLYASSFESVNVNLHKANLLFVGIHDDNYSWGNKHEAEEKDIYIDMLRKYICDEEEWLAKMGAWQ